MNANVFESQLESFRKDNERLSVWLRWIADHVITECVPPESPYLNMSPSEGAQKALDGESIGAFIE